MYVKKKKRIYIVFEVFKYVLNVCIFDFNEYLLLIIVILYF